MALKTYTAIITYFADGQRPEHCRADTTQGAVDAAMDESAVNTRRILRVEDSDGTILLIASIAPGVSLSQFRTPGWRCGVK